MKLRATLTDYVVIAISPALIMALIGSLVFFLIELLYQGQYQARLQYVFALFVFASVLIGRISIEEGREKAMGFAVVLGVAVLLVLAKFVQFSGIFAQFSWGINVGLIVLILWCANKLTWDCTVIDDQEDASGEGLLQTAGLDDEPEGAHDPTVDIEATSGVEETQPKAAPKTLWQRFVEARRKKHAPGVWVLYFSMAALPIFGIGQGFMFGQGDDSRRFVFKLLVVYVAAALGLLLTTSFLGLRRYLRQRRLEMPTQMAGAWLGVGAVMIVALLLFCMLLPRRNAEYSITDLPAFAGSPDDLKPSSWGFGNDGPEEEDANRQVNKNDAEKQSDKSGDQQGDNKDSQQKTSRGKEKSSDQGDKGKQKDSSKSPGKNEKSDQQESGDESQQKQQGKQSGSDKGEKSKSKQGEKQDESSDKQGKSGEKQDSKRQGNRENEQAKNEAQKKNSSKQQSQSKNSSPSRIAQQIGGGIGQLMKLLYWLIVILIVGWFLWRYWAQVCEAVRNFIRAMKEFWAKLFGGQVDDTAEVEPELVDAGPPPKPFSDFANPFHTEMHARLSVDQLVAYSFEAFEAWAREHGCGRGPEQTPHEFAATVGRSATQLAQEGVRLAELYCRSAYSKDSLPPASLDHLRQFWNQLGSAGHAL